MQGGCNAFLITCWTVLIELELPFQARNLDFDADYAAHLLLHKIVRQGERPGPLEARFRLLCQAPQHSIQRSGILNNTRPAMCMHNRVVPGRHAERLLVPGGRYISMRPLKDDQRLTGLIKAAPMRIGARKMA